MAETIEEITTVERTPTQVVRKTTHLEPSLEEPPQKVFKKRKAIFRFNQVVWYILGIVEILLGFRVLLKSLGANPFSGFTTFIYSLSDPLALPFQGIFRTSVGGNGVYVIEWSTIFAMLVYALIAYGAVEIFQFVKPVTKTDMEHAAI